jgi:hypothetical protein
VGTILFLNILEEKNVKRTEIESTIKKNKPTNRQLSEKQLQFTEEKKDEIQAQHQGRGK